MHYCFNCGKSIPQRAKFCPVCGENLAVSAVTEPTSQAEEKSPETSLDELIPDLAVYEELVNANFTLLNAGDDFRGYKILRMLNKDAEGIKYIAEKSGQEYVLKIFFKSSFQNMNTLFALQMRLSRLNKLKDAHTAKVVEVNQNHSPAYMAVEYVHGVSLAEVKKYNPERLSEELVRKLILSLIRTTIQIRKHGLTIGKLTPTSIMLNDKVEPVILSSGISYEEGDEREDVFVLAMIAAQILSKSTLYKSIYSEARLRDHKFTYIIGVSLDLNKILAESLHRNITQRYASLQGMHDALTRLPELANAEICTTVEQNLKSDTNVVNDDMMPKFRVEIGFWILIAVVIGLILMLFTTNIYTVIFGAQGDKLQYKGFVFGSAADDDSLNVVVNSALPRANSSGKTTYGELKSGQRTERIDPRRINSPAQNTSTSQSPIVQAPKPSSRFVYIEPGILAFGRLGDNPANSVSLSGYYISKYEVTQAEWNRYMKPAAVSTVGENLPVDNISWFDIAIYCNGRSEAENLSPAYKIRGVGVSRVITVDWSANGYRLPSEAEWEMAAKSGESYSYSGSDEATEVAWYRENSAGKIRNPGAKQANASGIYDMSGNVAEWVWDWYDANYLRALPTFVNPTGPATGTQKTIRGGNVMNGEGRALNLLNRDKGDPNRQYQFVGFRLVRTK